MAAVSNATPLLAVDAAVIDTETTGLDPEKSRIVEFASIPVVCGRIEERASFRSLVRPGSAIPLSATAIHGIDDAKVANAPDFATLWPDIAPHLGGLVIGHALGFDLAMIESECRRAGFSPPRIGAMLDTRLLATIAGPQLPEHTLESLASWLNVEASGRHSALGDALATARIFRALIPKLRDKGIRSLGEAAAACRALNEALEQQQRIGWGGAKAATGADDGDRMPGRIDSFPYRHRVRDLMRSPPRILPPEASLREAISVMMREKISSIFVAPGADAPEAARCGIVTERDALRAIAEAGPAALDRPVSAAMSMPLVAVAADAFVYRAIGRMSRLRLRHLGVVDELGHVVGALSARDLLRLRAGEAISLGDEIEEAVDSHGLAAAWAKLPHVAASLLVEAVPARDVAAVISRELGTLTHQAAVIAERELREAGKGEPPCAYALAVLGSAGRGESLLAMDQDNAIVFAEGEPGGAADRYFEALGTRVADLLHEAGVPYCSGGVMAKNAGWRGSAETWRRRIGDWVGRSSPQDLLSVDIFFDWRGVHGDLALAGEIARFGLEAAKDNVGFAKLLTEAAGESENGLGLFGRFRTMQGRIDLKKAGLFGIVATARALAIRHRIAERSTAGRLAAIKALGIGGESDLDALADAHADFLEFILAQQIADLESGESPSNRVAIDRLSGRDRDRLRKALEAVRHLDELRRDLLFRD